VEETALHLNDLYSSPNIVRVIKLRRMRRAGHVTRMGDRTGVHRILLGNLREKDHLEHPGVDGRIILIMYLQVVGCGDMDWIDMAQDKERGRSLMNMVMNFRVP